MGDLSSKSPRENYATRGTEAKPNIAYPKDASTDKTGLLAAAKAELAVTRPTSTGHVSAALPVSEATTPPS